MRSCLHATAATRAAECNKERGSRPPVMCTVGVGAGVFALFERQCPNNHGEGSSSFGVSTAMMLGYKYDTKIIHYYYYSSTLIIKRYYRY